MRSLCVLALLPLLALPSPAWGGAPVTAGFTSRGFTLSDPEGNNALFLGLSFQPRLTLQVAGDPEVAGADRLDDSGFRVRRMLLLMGGTLAGHIDFRFRVDTARAFTFNDGDDKSQQGGRPILDDALVVFRIADPFQVSFGQWKVPFTGQQMMSDTTLLFPDRALPIDGLKYGDVKVGGFSWARDIGVAVQGNIGEKRFEYQVGVFGGDGANVWPPADTGLLLGARFQAAPLGEFAYDEVDLKRGPPRLAVGGGVTVNSHPTYDDEGEDAGTSRELRVGGELRFAVKGLSVNAEVLYGSLMPVEGDSVGSIGFYAQAGYLFPWGVAPGFRYSRLDPSLADEDDAVQQVEGVVNLYLPDPADKGKNLGHKAQVQLAFGTALKEGLEHPLFHQGTLAVAVGF